MSVLRSRGCRCGFWGGLHVWEKRSRTKRRRGGGVEVGGGRKDVRPDGEDRIVGWKREVWWSIVWRRSTEEKSGFE